MPFATSDDVQGRLMRDLTTAEAASIDLLLDLATILVAEAADKDEDWANALDPVLGVLRMTTIEVVYRAFQNPTGAASVTETLGAYSHTERWDSQAATAIGLAVTPGEERRIRRAVYGSNAGSARANTIANHLGYCAIDDEIFISEDLIAS